ncbi:MAG TPA: hypothetical protein DCX54_02795 [Flavobacteriales bacterium]|nr:hypothetical protein [Flavobacteriales bacterium]
MKLNKPKSEIQKACLNGVESAYRKYFEFSGGQSLWYAPESFIQAEIATFLAKVCPYVTLEDGVRDLLQNSNATLKGKPPRKGRIDIITWWENGTPRKLIEVKKAYCKDAIKEDAKRLRQMIGRGGSTRKGLIVAYTSAVKKETIANRFVAIASSSDSTLICNLGAKKCLNADESWHWDAGCFMV